MITTGTLLYFVVPVSSTARPAGLTSSPTTEAPFTLTSSLPEVTVAAAAPFSSAVFTAPVVALCNGDCTLA